MVIRLCLALALLLGAVMPARADDIGATGRGVVRVVTIAVVDGRVVGFGHGSGFAIAPNRVVTNAHVMELAERYPDNVIIGIVPSEGDKSFEGRVVAYDSRADLAMVEFTGARLPPATLYSGPTNEGDAVIALGYPGNVDIATARSAADYIRPMSPVRSEGGFSGRRTLTGIEVLLHTAAIARGNSGGPLLDRCGRVIGVNSAITRGEEGDGSFGFAIADTELASFLREAKQPFATIGTPCTSIEERLRADSAADAQAVADAATARREAATRAGIARDEALARARGEADRARENVMGLAGLLLVASALGLGFAGLLATRARLAPALWMAAIGSLGVAAAIAIFVLRPSGDIVLPPLVSAASAPVVADRALGRLVCTLLPDRSRITVSPATDVALDWGAAGCVDGRTQYVAANGRWERVAVPQGEQTVSILGFDPATGTYTNTRYLMSAPAMTAARAVRGSAAATCSPDPTAAAALAQRQSAIRATLPPLPNEKLVYRCKPS